MRPITGAVTVTAALPPGKDEAARAGLAAATAAYGLWGLLPLYLKLVGFASPSEVLAHRILWSLPAAALAVIALKGADETRKALKQRGVLRALVLSATLIGVNWWFYVWAVAQSRVIEASLAYFLTPLVNVAFGVLFFREVLTRLQVVSLGLAAAGVAVQALALGAPPWIALALCATWSCYGLVRKRAPVPAAGGLLVETAILAPVAAAGLGLLALSGAPLAFDDAPANAVLLALAGPATALPLMLFAFGARRLRFSTLGLLQYIAPTLQFAVGLSFGEAFTPLRAASFALIWAGLALFSYDAWRRERAR